MNKRSQIVIVAVLIVVIFVSSFLVYEFVPPPSHNLLINVLWQHPIENFAVSLAVYDGKVFTTDTSGNLNSFDSQTGKSLWNSTGTFYSDAPALGNQIYVGLGNNQVGCLNESNGQLLWSFQNEFAPNSGFRGSPQIIVKDNQVFAISDTISAHNATNGELLWQDSPTGFSVGYFMQPNKTWTGGHVPGYPLTGDPFDGNYVYATTGSNFSSMYIFKLNTANGQIVWNSNVTWDATPLTFGLDYSLFAPQVLATISGQVIIEKAADPLSNTQPAINQLLSLDSNTGKEIWSINLAANFYNPTVYGDKLFFGGSDGNFYVINLANGKVAWKTDIDKQNLFSTVNTSNYALTSLIQIDSQNQRIFWNFAIKQSGTENYTETLCNLNLSTGNENWINQLNDVGNNLLVGTGLTYDNAADIVFLTQNAHLWIFDATTGENVLSQQSDHYVLLTVVPSNETFVAADLLLTAYK
jgi:outer membrane protein assembly factor BamB